MIRAHLIDRHMNVDFYNGVWIEDETVTFALWNLSGQMVGFQQYRPFAEKGFSNDPRQGRYYTRLGGVRGQRPMGVWGMESLSLRGGVLFVCEGIFDACRLHNLGIPCIAVLSSNTNHVDNFLLSCGRKIVGVPDDHASEFPYDVIKIPETRKDLGECTDCEILKALAEYDESLVDCTVLPVLRVIESENDCSVLREILTSEKSLKKIEKVLDKPKNPV